LLLNAMTHPVYNVLFVCTGNSVRSVMAECLMNHLGAGRFQAFSAGSMPNGTVNPQALATLASLAVPAQGVRSKSWAEFSQADAPVLDFIFTVCDQAAGEVCPVWPGQPVSAHWGVADPSEMPASTPAQTEKNFRDAAYTLKRRIELFMALPFDSLDRLSLQAHAQGIGQQ
jgi:protein-tyrosine-phosphatase